MTPAPKKSARALIEAAERLIATHGLNVPLRDIGEAAGAANRVAVQYHFGDRQSLIEAVFRYRLPLLEQRRATILARIDDPLPSIDTAALVDALLRPIADIQDACGRHPFAGFLYQLTANDRSARAAFDELAPVAKDIVGRILASMPPASPQAQARRLGSASLLFLDTLVRLDERDQLDVAGVDEAVALAAAVLRTDRFPQLDVQQQQ